MKMRYLAPEVSAAVSIRCRKYLEEFRGVKGCFKRHQWCFRDIQGSLECPASHGNVHETLNTPENRLKLPVTPLILMTSLQKLSKFYCPAMEVILPFKFFIPTNLLCM